MFSSLREWWNRPPALTRILEALSHDEWRAPWDVIKTARVSIGGFYSRVFELERDGIVESKWDDGPIPASRMGRRRRLYRLAK